MSTQGWRRWILLLAVALGVTALLARCGGEDPAEAPDEDLGYVGRASCAVCHELAHEQWSGSDHDLAMQEASASTVLGNFNGTEFVYRGVTSRFEKEGERYFVTTEGTEKDKLERYSVRYVFGHYPLQQYLVVFPDGRYQCLPLCWDSRPKEQGGQRWFHIYQDERIVPGDPLHWLSPQQNWNYMCAECHSTNLQRHYDKESDRFATTWSEIDVSCETCHGPGKDHVTWAAGDMKGDPRMARDLRLTTDGGHWAFPEGENTAKFVGKRNTQAQLESCAPCHSRRYDLVHIKKHDKAFDDQYHLSLLREGLYHADGQIIDEVYVYGSFLQSKMHTAGVVCTDCHDPHTLKVKIPGNGLCAQCHKPEFYDAESHHHHKPGTAGAQCVDCHMPTRNYMVVDPRLDHSMRVPRPDLTQRIGTPNACNACHDEQSTKWAQESIVKWYGTGRSSESHYGIALAAGQRGVRGAVDLLIRMAEDSQFPGIARASGALLLANYPSPKRDASLAGLLTSKDSLVRRAAIEGLDNAPDETRLGLLANLLEDPVLDVRLAAFLNLARIPTEKVTGSLRKKMKATGVEYIRFFESRADRPDAWFGLANLHQVQGRLTQAESAYKQALAREPGFVLARANLSDLYRQTGREMECDRILREGLVPRIDVAPLYHALGLSLIRRKQIKEAEQQLGMAARLRPDMPRFVYVHALALQQIGLPEKGLEALEATRKRFPTNQEILVGLVSLHEALGHRSQALGIAQELVELFPDNPNFVKQVQRLEAGK